MALSCTAAFAQEVVLEGIVITGEKLDRPYLETTTSVGVATGEDIETYSIDSVYESFNRMANVRYFGNNGANSAFQIRGLNADGVSEIANAVPLVSVIIDGATQNREGIRRGARGTWDLKQIEVLRGPQSGLYGRTALAGAVVIESNDPTYHWQTAFKAAASNYEHKDGGIMLSGPLIADQMAFRISAEGLDEVKDIGYDDVGNNPLAEDQYRNVRGKLLIEPSALSGFKALLTASRTFDKPASNVVNGDFFDRKLSGTSLFTEFREIETTNTIANVSYAFSEGFTLRSISSKIVTDLAVASAPSSTIYFRDDNRGGDDFTQDVRLEIDDKSRSGVSGVIGAFYGDFQEVTESEIAADIGFGFLVPVQVGNIANVTETKAVYADLRYNVFGGWSLLGGLRYQEDAVRNSANVTSLFGDSTYDYEAEFSVLLPKYGLAYEIDQSQSVAVTASKGYRQGFTENIIATSDVNEVDPEFAWTYEVAYRLVSPDKRTTFGTNVFYNDYQDQQITIVNPNFPPFTNTFNVGSSHSYGAEFEGNYDFGIGLKVFGAVGLLKTEFDELEDAVCAPSGGSCKGNEYPEAPNLTVSVGGVYRHDSGAFAAVDANYTGDYYSTGDINNLETFRVENRILVNAKVGYEFEKVTASIFAKNLFDEDYITGLSPTATEASIGDGRLIGVELLGKF
ncbi:MAG: TonB-dependent receptor [Hyphomicrobiaceae bacterium]|nr:TonB-dependent receptor [Hyphomicrobiaceae bacterium]